MYVCMYVLMHACMYACMHMYVHVCESLLELSLRIVIYCTVRPASALPVELLELHASVLEPDLDLSVGQVDTPTDLQAALPRQIHVEQELLLQLQRLVLCVGTALFPSAFGFQPASRGLFLG